MGYNEMLQQSKVAAADRLLATKILDLMDKLRLSKNPDAPKRWIWELLQNAKDVSYEEGGVAVTIELKENTDNQIFLIFSHNGRPFNADNITFLIQQVSTKDRNHKIGVKKTTGKFGTGFLTTHLLSEKVIVEGIVKEENLPYKRFSVQLDRSARDIEAVIASVDTSLKAIGQALTEPQPAVKFNPTEFNTSFLYELANAKVSLAQEGISDLHKSLPYTLAFSPEIRSVEVLHEGIKYHIDGKPQTLAQAITLITIVEEGKLTKAKELKMIVVQGKMCSIAIEVQYEENIVHVKPIQSDQPRLFCDFPLIGSEDFPFPVVINSASFNPNEPRSAVWLTNVEDSRVLENESILAEAVDLYFILLDHASRHNWQELFNLIYTKPADETEWLSEDWYNENIVSKLRYKILRTKLVDNAISGRICILDEFDEPQVSFPASSDANIREHIWQLCNAWKAASLPPLDQIHHWYEVIWEECDQIGFSTIAAFIQENEDLRGLSTAFNYGKDDVMDWLNKFYKVIDMDVAFANEIENDSYNVIPNQNELFKCYSDLYMDVEVDDELKDVLHILGEDIRDSLILQEAYPGELTFDEYVQQQLVDRINKLLQDGKVEAKKKFDACDHIVSLFADDPAFPSQRREFIYEISRLIYPTTVGEKRAFRYFNEEIFNEADKIQIKVIVQYIGNTGSIDNLTEGLGFGSSKATIKWLHNFIEFMVNNDFDSQLNLKTSPILPNQNGEFRIKENLNLDNGEIPEALKDICADLGTNYREELLDKGIFLKLPETRVVTEVDVANEIIRLIMPKMAEIPRSDDTKGIFKKLYLFFTKNSDMSRDIFGDLYKTKHTLYDHEEIAANMEMIDEMNILFDEHNIQDIDGLRKVLQQIKLIKIEESSVPPTKEILANLGIASEKEYKQLVGKDVFSGIFRHVPTPTPEMYKYAAIIRNRAKKNVIAHLKTLPQYVVNDDELDELAPTVIGGIRKEGLLIHIVFRPSDDGQVLFYYPSEKATLDLANAELWIDDGKTNPSHLTLGRILTVTGINRIPI